MKAFMRWIVMVLPLLVGCAAQSLDRETTCAPDAAFCGTKTKINHW